METEEREIVEKSDEEEIAVGKIMETEESEVVEKADEEEIIVGNECQQNSSDPRKRFRCELCGFGYTIRSSLQRHCKRKHNDQLCGSWGKMKCPFPTCSFYCASRKNLRIHLSQADTHNITFRSYRRTFKSMEDFNEWKIAEEQKTRALFVKSNNTRHYQNGVFPMYYLCNRSGLYEQYGVDGKERTRKKTKKINGICPAAMNVTIGRGKVDLLYHKTHVGHGDEWHYQWLSKPEKEYIACRLSRGFSFDKILNDIRNDETFAGQRIRMVTKKDMRNIMRSYGLKRDEEEIFSDLKNTDSWVTQLKDFTFSPVLLYKPRGIAMDNRHSLLHKKDYMLSIMTEGQKQMFEMLPASVVGIYCSLESNSHHFFLITLFIVDEGGLPFPVAYCLTSRTDDKAIKAFLSSLKEKIGTIKASLLISDGEDMWYSAWTEVMGLPSKHIMYFPHLKHKWKKKLCKLPCTTEKQEKICTLLGNLSTESDCSKFELLLKSFIDQTESDGDLNEFQTYFKSKFLDKTDMWALCYYADAGLLTVAHLEEMHKRIHCTCFYEGTPKSVDLCIRELLLLTHKYFYEHLSKIYRETDFIEQAIILNHKNNEQLYSIEIECDEHSDKWKIRTNDDESVYCVKRADSECPDEMLLYCPLCQVFLDMYTCNCVDYLIMCTICEHVHAITRLSKACVVTTENTSEDAVIHLLEAGDESISCENADYLALVRDSNERIDETHLIELLQV